MSQAGVPDPNLRASDADRERIVEQLRQHTADGRLTMDEFEQRMTAAYAARTYGELTELTRDLPVDLGARAREAGGASWSAGPFTTGPFSTGPFTTGPSASSPVFGSLKGSGGEVVEALVGAAIDWKLRKAELRRQLRHRRRQEALARRANAPLVAGFAGWAFLSVILTGIWFMAGVTGGGFGDFWPIWPIGVLGLLTVVKAVKTVALRRELGRR